MHPIHYHSSVRAVLQDPKQGSVWDDSAFKNTYNNDIILHCILLFLVVPSLNFTKSPRNSRNNESQEFHTFNKLELSTSFIKLLKPSVAGVDDALSSVLSPPFLPSFPACQELLHKLLWTMFILMACGMLLLGVCKAPVCPHLWASISISGNVVSPHSQMSSPRAPVRTPPAPILVWKEKRACKDWWLYSPYCASSYLSFS